MKIQKFLFMGLLFFPISSFSEDDPKHRVSTAGGLSSPSVISALGENPAGLANNGSGKVDIAGVLGTSGGTLGAGVGYFTGNKTVGGGIALQGFNSDRDSPGNVLLLNWGVASKFKMLNVAVGFTGTTTLARAGDVGGTGSGTTWCVDTGLIINPDGRFRFGLTAFQLLANVLAYGGGFTYDLNEWGGFVLDAAYTIPSRTAALKPGLRIHLNRFQISSSFGFKFIERGWTWITDGLTLGAGASLSSSVRLTGYFNHIARGYLGLDILL